MSRIFGQSVHGGAGGAGGAGPGVGAGAGSALPVVQFPALSPSQLVSRNRLQCILLFLDHAVHEVQKACALHMAQHASASAALPSEILPLLFDWQVEGNRCADFTLQSTLRGCSAAAAPSFRQGKHVIPDPQSRGSGGTN